MRAHPGSAYTHLLTGHPGVTLQGWRAEGGGGGRANTEDGVGLVLEGKGVCAVRAAALVSGQLPLCCFPLQNQVHVGQWQTGKSQRTDGGHADCRQGRGAGRLQERGCNTLVSTHYKGMHVKLKT